MRLHSVVNSVPSVCRVLITCCCTKFGADAKAGEVPAVSSHSPSAQSHPQAIKGHMQGYRLPWQLWQLVKVKGEALGLVCDSYVVEIEVRKNRIREEIVCK